MERKTFVTKYAESLVRGRAALFIGAGLSAGAGYPDWRTLLEEMAIELKLDLNQEHNFPEVAQFYIAKCGDHRDGIARIVKKHFSRQVEVPAVHQVLARLNVGQVWTTNYDKLIERAWELRGSPLDVKAANSEVGGGGAGSHVTTLYKMHGTVDRAADVVIAKEDYRQYPKEWAGFEATLRAHLIQYNFLFVGLSFTDPNIDHALEVIRNTMEKGMTPHYAIVRKPQRSECEDDGEFTHRLARHPYWVRELQRSNIQCVEIDDFSEIEKILAEIVVAAGLDWPDEPPPLDWAEAVADHDQVLTACKHLLTRNAAGRFITLRGPSDTGKSCLTRQLLRNGLRLGWLTCARFDFKGATGWDVELEAFARGLNVTPRLPPNMDLSHRLTAILTAVAQKAQPTLLIFDTYEAAFEVQQWFERLLRDLDHYPQVRMVVAGRCVPPETEPLQRSASGGAFELSFPPPEAWLPFGQRHHPDINLDFVRQAHASCNGRASILAQLLGPER